MRFSYGMMSYVPADQAVGLIREAEHLGFHGAYLADDPSGRDPWVLLAAAARETERIRLGVSATHVFLRDPTLIAHTLATLDELSAGRAEAVVSYGDPGILDAYHVEWRGTRPLARVREALGVMRAFLDRGEVDHEGEFFRYSGVSTGVRPVQRRLPLLVGAIGGPRSFEMAGEVADGVHCVGNSRANSEYVVDHVTRGADRVGRDVGELDLVAAAITAVADDGDAARQAARPVVAGWIPSFPDSLIERHHLAPAHVAGIREAMGRGDLKHATELTTPEMVDALSISGTPEECADQVRRELLDGGIEHVAFALVDQSVVDSYAGPQLPALPDARTQLRLISERLVPALAA
jgi:5,10-methylenetetrahydromethanopterin reductase